MSIVLIMLTIDTLAAISPGGSHVPPYTVINQQHGDAENVRRVRKIEHLEFR